MLPRRSARLSIDIFSPRLSCNRKKLGHLHTHQNPIGWSTTGTDVVEDTESRATAGSLTTEMMMLGRKRDSSFGSCGPWSMASLMEKLPVTPSPICSPVSSSCSPPSELYFSQDSTDHSSPANNQIPCTRNDTKSPSPSHEELEKEKRELSSVEKQRAYDRSHQRKLSSMNSPFPTRKIATDTERFSICYNCHKPTSNAAMSTRSSGLRFLYESTESVCPRDDCIDDGRLPAVSEEQDASWYQKVHHLGSCAVNYRSSHLFSQDNSGYGSSDMESVMEEHLRSAVPASARPIHGFTSEIKRKELEKAHKLINGLRKKVTEISEWEKKHMAKAKMEWREYEMKLEKKRAKAMEKMQRRIQSARKKAERKKVKERSSAVKKMAKIRRAFKKIESTGKLPWKLIFL